ncbi:MAG TPA: hypothetical protein VIM61_11510 [Chthoniobacterales bacterium]|jgi:hypothetical protein
MNALLKAVRKTGPALRIAAAILGLAVAGFMFNYTTGGIGHGKMYLGPQTRHGIIIYRGENAPAFVAATVFNYAFATMVLAVSVRQLIRSASRRRG